MMIGKDDWRYINGEHLKDKSFTYKTYKPLNKENDHDHCEFCWDKFSLLIDDALKEGYQTMLIQDDLEKDLAKKDAWVCRECFNDFKDLLNLKIK